ncbi:MAG: glycosyltransferase family 4 protein [Planctomycetota bacterium]
MKILHVVSGYLPQDSGGTQMHVRDLCAAQRRLGHEVGIFTRQGGTGAEHLSVVHDEWEGVPVARLNNDFVDVDRFELLFSHPVIDRRFGEHLRAFRPDLVHVHHLTCLSTSMVDVARRAGLPVVMTLHDYWMVCPRGQRIHPDDLSICAELDRRRCLPCLQALWPHLLPRGPARGLLGRLLGRASSAELLRAWERRMHAVLDACDATISPSRFHRDRFVEWGLDPRRARVVTHGLPRAELEAEPRGTRPVRSIGYVGTVIPSKGIHVLVDAFVALGRPELRLDVHGEAPSFHGQVSYVDELRGRVPAGLDVRFHGRYENRDLPAVLAGLDVVVVPSLWWESFCLTAREAALAGRPVVGSRLGGVGEAVEDGLALGFAPGDAADLAAVLARLVDDPALRDGYSRKGGLVRDLDDCARETLEVYRAVLGVGAGEGA